VTSRHNQHLLGSTITSMTQLCHHQHDSTTTSHNILIVKLNNDICFQWQVDMLPTHTNSIHHYKGSMQVSHCAAWHLCVANIHI
jgi:hypothetical protein